ncbi:hypothetical protein TRICI_006548 [Trichomonascus ciferrii]|uniref:F-box domain-containing protein n=1 Tax=Trichomonascus ciferrii TaxID=44093 RepID=A0A642UGG3_9ASCO|nr:hypothetical protein TRICI_006548 [Trichomonascus ciferrii]
MERDRRVMALPTDILFDILENYTDKHTLLEFRLVCRALKEHVDSSWRLFPFELSIGCFYDGGFPFCSLALISGDIKKSISLASVVEHENSGLTACLGWVSSIDISLSTFREDNSTRMGIGKFFKAIWDALSKKPVIRTDFLDLMIYNSSLRTKELLDVVNVLGPLQRNPHGSGTVDVFVTAEVHVGEPVLGIFGEIGEIELGSNVDSVVLYPCSIGDSVFKGVTLADSTSELKIFPRDNLIPGSPTTTECHEIDFRVISSLTQLVTLDISGMEISDPMWLEKLPESLRSLILYDVVACENYGPQSIDIEHLEIIQCNLGSLHEVQLPKLSELFLGTVPVHAASNVLPPGFNDSLLANLDSLTMNFCNKDDLTSVTSTKQFPKSPIQHLSLTADFDGIEIQDVWPISSLSQLSTLEIYAFGHSKLSKSLLEEFIKTLTANCPTLSSFRIGITDPPIRFHFANGRITTF